MTKKKTAVITLLTILAVAALLRLVKLGDDGHPLLWDEVANGYNAYSILKTGRDEYGTLFPIVLKSFGNWGPALPSYVTIPTIALFGLNEFAVRLPSALAGIVVVALIWAITRELLPGRQWAALFASLAAAFNPWLVHFSRGGWEANINLALTLLGVWAFLLARKRPPFVVLSAVVFGLTFMTYQSAKLATPLIVLGLVVAWGKEIYNQKPRLTIGSIVVLILVASPIFLQLSQTGGRLSVLNILTYDRPAQQVAEVARQEQFFGSVTPVWLFHGEWLATARRVMEGYFNHFSGRFLFYEGDWNDGRLGSPYVGQFYWLDLPLILLGLWTLAHLPDRKTSLFVLYWIVISPIPSALSVDIIHAIRSFNLAVPFIILIGLGLAEALVLLKHLARPLALGSVLIFVAAYSFNILYYLDSYYVHAPVIYSKDWLYGYKQAVQTLDQVNPGNIPVVFTQKLGQPYIYILFYNRVDTALYQSQAHLTVNPSGDVGRIDKFANFTFRNIYWPADRGDRNTFFVGTEDELPLKDINPKQAKLIKDILAPGGAVALRIVKTL